MVIKEEHRASYYSTVLCFLKLHEHPAIKMVFQIDLALFM